MLAQIPTHEYEPQFSRFYHAEPHFQNQIILKFLNLLMLTLS